MECKIYFAAFLECKIYFAAFLECKIYFAAFLECKIYFAVLSTEAQINRYFTAKGNPKVLLRSCCQFLAKVLTKTRAIETRSRDARPCVSTAGRASLINRYFTVKGNPKVLPPLLVASIKIPENLGFRTYFLGIFLFIQSVSIIQSLSFQGVRVEC
ncbi:hypothetical protein BGS_0767 [Beggiatoa sp. SS]|nr:hypothetical protein BGS_0767 [Beggiatoa sp. SS]